MLGVVQQVVDDGQVFEIAQDYAKNIITGAPACARALSACALGTHGVQRWYALFASRAPAACVAAGPRPDARLTAQGGIHLPSPAAAPALRLYAPQRPHGGHSGQPARSAGRLPGYRCFSQGDCMC